MSRPRARSKAVLLASFTCLAAGCLDGGTAAPPETTQQSSDAGALAGAHDAGALPAPSGSDAGEPIAPVRLLSGAVTTSGCGGSPNGEGVEKLLDGAPTTKFLAFNNTVAVDFDAREPEILRRYALTSANDFPERDPAAWVLRGSNDGKTWTDLDVRTGQRFAKRFERRELEISNTSFFRYYRLRMENVSSGSVQLAELELFGRTPRVGPAAAAPPAPAGPRATAASRTAVELTWEDRAFDEVYVEVEQSVDGSAWTAAGYAGPNATRLTLTGLPPSQALSFRVRAVNSAGPSAYSGTSAPLTLPPVSRTVQPSGAIVYTEDGYTLTVVQDPQVPAQTVTAVVEEFFATYPAMAARFNPQAPRSVRLTYDPQYAGVAYASGGAIVISSAYARGAPLDVDVITHEGFHVVQAYPGAANIPGWAVEGLADHARYRFGRRNVQSCWTVPRYEAGQAHTDGYGVTARFLLWVEAKVRPAFIAELDASLRSGRYTDALWAEKTGKSAAELFAAYAADPERPPHDYE